VVDRVAVLVQHGDGAVLPAQPVQRGDVEGDHELRAVGGDDRAGDAERVAAVHLVLHEPVDLGDQALRLRAGRRDRRLDPRAVGGRHAAGEAGCGLSLGRGDPGRVGREPVADGAVAGAEQQRPAGERRRGERGDGAQEGWFHTHLDRRARGSP
jgi:hypothetical protein